MKNKDQKKKDQEFIFKVNTWWGSLRYLQKLDILLEDNPGYDIANIERKGINNLWNTNSLKRKGLIMLVYEKEKPAGTRNLKGGGFKE